MARSSVNLLDLLVGHGISERGARVYLAVCRQGPQTASELARSTGVNRVEAYRFIRQLQDEGLVHAVGRRPMRFAALPPDALLDRWIHTASESLDHLRNHRDRLHEDLEAVLATPDDSDPRKFAVLEGRRAVQRFLIKRMGAAAKEILISTGGFALSAAIDAGIHRVLEAASKRGVKVRVVTDVTTGTLAEAKLFAPVGEVRHAVSPVTNRVILIDRIGALVYVSGEEGLGASGEDQVAIWSTSTSFIHLAREYHQRLWTRAIHFEDRLVQIESPPTAVLPMVAGREDEPFQRLREIAQLGMRAVGVPAVDLNLSELIETLARQIGRRVAGSVRGATPEEVARSLADYYARQALGQLHVVRNRPLVLKVTDCFACTSQSPEIGRVMCPVILRTVLEARLGSAWDVTKPDPRRHATRGCLFTATPA
ncbi:MAG: TrmB family transcriptional regulator [Thermoplasmata archaeon]